MDSYVVLSSALAIRRIDSDSSRNPARCSAWLRAKAIAETLRQMADLRGYTPPLARNQSEPIEVRREMAFVIARFQPHSTIDGS